MSSSRGAGYLAIHMLGLSIGTLILPPSPSFFRRRQKQLLKQKQKKRRLSDAPHDADDKGVKDTFGVHRENDKTAIELFSYSTLWWAFLGVTKLTGIGSPTGGAAISRRMVRYLPTVSGTQNSFHPSGQFTLCPMGRCNQHHVPAGLFAC